MYYITVSPLGNSAGSGEVLCVLRQEFPLCFADRGFSDSDPKEQELLLRMNLFYVRMLASWFCCCYRCCYIQSPSPWDFYFPNPWADPSRVLQRKLGKGIVIPVPPSCPQEVKLVISKCDNPKEICWHFLSGHMPSGQTTYNCSQECWGC